jgi:hypothetical protein
MGYVGTYLALTAALFLLFHLTGHAASRRLVPLPEKATPEERLALRVVIGVALWVMTLFALAALQRLRPAPIGGLIATAALAGLWSVWRERREGGTATGPRSSIAPRDPFALLLLAVAAVVLIALWSQTLRPIVAWDADVYHLTVPRLYLEHGGFYRIPFNVYSNWPLATQLLFTLAMVIEDYVLATALHFGFGVLLLAVLGMAAARASNVTWGVIAAVTLLLHPVFLFEIRIAYVDIACAFFLFAGFLAVERAIESPDAERRWLVLAGIACGVLAAAKLNGVFGALCVGSVYFGSRLLSRARPRSIVTGLIAFAAPVAVLGAPWLAKSLVLTGNPVYPLLYGTFGGPEWSETLARAHGDWQRAIGMGRSALDTLLLPIRVLFLGGEGYGRFDGRMHPLAGILLPFALIGARFSPTARRALALAGLWFVLWGATSQQMRFLIPALPLLAYATAVGCHGLTLRFLRGSPWPARALALAAVPLLIVANQRYLEQAPSLYRAFASHPQRLREHSTDEVFRIIDQRLPPGAKILFVNINRGFFCRREYIADSFFEASQTDEMLWAMAESTGIRRGLRDRGITHLLIENRSRGIDYPPQFLRLLDDPANRIVYESPDERFTLIALPG